MIQTLRAEEPRGVPSSIPRRPEGDKIARVMGASAMIQAGGLFLPGGPHWLGDFASEVFGFPGAEHDDQVDALAQLLLCVQEKDLYRELETVGPELSRQR